MTISVGFEKTYFTLNYRYLPEFCEILPLINCTQIISYGKPNLQPAHSSIFDVRDSDGRSYGLSSQTVGSEGISK